MITEQKGLTSVPSPLVLPAFAAQHTVRIGRDADDEGPALPAELRPAIGSRRREFLAGRYCAARALAALLDGGPVEIARYPDGAPAWPSGIVGSITHVDGWASAAAARATDAAGIGIDSERLERFLKPASISGLVVLPAEEALDIHPVPSYLKLPLVFSAKEAIFKCLYPLAGRRFYFLDAALIGIDPSAGTFVARLTTTLAPGLGPDREVRGRFVFDDAYVHTGAWLPADNLIR